MSDSRLKKSFNNAFIGVMNRVMMLVFNFVLHTVMIKYLGVEIVGINGTFADVMQMVCMADLGFNTAVVFTFYEPLANNDRKTIIELTSFFRKIYNTIAIVIAVVGLCVVPFLDQIVNTKQPIPHLTLYYLLALAEAIGSYLFAYKISVMTADQKEYLRIRINMVFNLIKAVLQIVFVVWLGSYGIYLVLALCSTVGSNILASRRAEKDYPYIKERGKLAIEKQKEILVTIKAVVVYKFSNIILGCTDNFLMSMLIGTAYVGYYSNYFLLVNALSTIMKIVFRGTTASIGNVMIKEDPATRYRIFDIMQIISFVMCGILIPCYFNLADDFVLCWLGEGFQLDRLSEIAICAEFYMTCVFLPIYIYREAVGLYKKSKYLLVSAAITNVILSVLFSFKLGMAGILLATPISRLINYVWYEPKILYDEYFERGVAPYYISCLKNAALIVFVVLTSGYISSLVAVTGWFTWILKGIVCGIVCLVITCGVYWRTEGFQWILRQAVQILQKVRKR